MRPPDGSCLSASHQARWSLSTRCRCPVMARLERGLISKTFYTNSFCFKERKRPSDTSVDEACVGLRARSGPKTPVKVHARENEGGSCVSVHCIQPAQQSKSCQGAKAEPWKNKVLEFIYFSTTCYLLLPIYHPKSCRPPVGATSHT